MASGPLRVDGGGCGPSLPGWTQVKMECGGGACFIYSAVILDLTLCAVIQVKSDIFQETSQRLRPARRPGTAFLVALPWHRDFPPAALQALAVSGLVFVQLGDRCWALLAETGAPESRAGPPLSEGS